MFQKILVVEDIEMAKYGIIIILTDKLGIPKDCITQTQSCDNALLMCKKAIQENTPFDLVITDLSFDKNYWDEKISSGYELIKEIKAHSKNTKIIVYSIEDKPIKVTTLFKEYYINGYVAKDSYDAKELLNAVNVIFAGGEYISTQLRQKMNPKNTIQLNEYNQLLIRKLDEGYSQKEVQQYFSEHNIKPNSISSIEKRLEKLRDEFKARSTSHLISILTDFGLI